MKIAIVDILGLSYDGSTLTKRGLGGSESAIILMAKELVDVGFDVTVYNDCSSDDSRPGIYNNVRYKPLSDVSNSTESYDIVVASRSVAPFAPSVLRGSFRSFVELPDFEQFISRCKYKVLWMHDTFCDGDQFIETFLNSGRINKIFTLSDFHTSYVTNCDHGAKRMFEVMKKYVFQTRNGIKRHIDWVDVKDKDPNLFVFNSAVNKGMLPLVHKVWPKVLQHIPNAKLTIIGGYYKFKDNIAPDQQEVAFREIVNLYGDTINFTGIISQKEIAEILAKASYMVYPAAFPETFGISALESLAYNTPIITCDFGALEETAIDAACYKIPYPVEPNSLFPGINSDAQVDAFVNMVIRAYNDKYLHQQKMYACNQIKDICTWDTVALQWKQHFYKALGEYLPVREYRKVSKINHDVHKVFGRRFSNPEELQEPRYRRSMHIDVIVPVYNAEKYIERCIKSIAAQDYPYYTVWIIDDCSTDNTYEVANRAIQLYDNTDMDFVLRKNEENKGAVCNQIETMLESVSMHCGASIVMLVDGDDWLVNDPNIFHKINNLYQEGAEFTYGSCWSVVDNIPLIAQPYPPEVKQNKSYRDYKFAWNMPYTHLRTFISSLVKRLGDTSAFQDENGDWLKAGGDTAVFYTMLEMANPDKVVCIPDVLYNYNDANPLNDYKVNGEEQTKTANKVIGKNEMNGLFGPNKKILIAIPTAKNIEPATFKAIYDLEIPDGYTADFQYFYGYAVDQVRNLIASWVVNNYDYLFAVDHDIAFAPDTLKKMIAHDKHVVSGIYRQRLEPQIIEIYDASLRNIPYESLPANSLLQIGGCGFGCALVKKEVLATIGYPQFVYHQALDHKHTFSEDLDFCKKATEKSYTIWVDTSILCDHYGDRIFKVS